MLDSQSLFLRGTERRALWWVRLLVVLVVFFHAGLAQSASMSSSHQPADMQDHSHGMVMAGLDDHDHHSHDHDDEADPNSGSHAAHDHNPFDHSHDKPNLPPLAFIGLTEVPRLWNAELYLSEYPSPYTAFERPPKSADMV